MPRSPYTLAATLLITAALITGCASNGGGYNEAPVEADIATGYYAGNWYGPNPDRVLGGLWCTVTPAGEDKWDAKFVATFGETGEYDVSLQGKREGNRVVFGGVEDLGASEGGAFDWTGYIEGDNFNGEYTASTYKGTFKMYRTEKPAE